MKTRVLENGVYLGTVEKNMAAGGLCITTTSYRNESAWEVMHAHANPHFSFVLSGGNLEKRKHASFDRLPGKLTFYHSGELHQNLHGGSFSRHINIELEPGFFRCNAITEAGLSQLADRNPSAKFLLLKLYKELLINDDLSDMGARALFLELIRQDQGRKQPVPAWASNLDAFLRDNLGEAVSLETLSRVTGAHPVTISKHFPKYCGCTLSEYVRKLRVEQALALIKSSHITLGEIALSCGFADQSHFIRNFKSYTGFMPGELRRI